MACARFARPMGVFWRRSHWAKVARVWSSTSRRMADLRPCIVPSSRVWDRSYGRSVCTCPVFPPLFNGGLYLAKPNLHIWHFPREWKIPLVLWALTVALSWPIVFLREVNFTPVLTLNTPAFNNRGGLPTNVAAAWVLQTAVIQGVGFLWIDWLFGTFRTDQRERFARYVLVPLGTSFVLTSLVAFYQAFIDIRFLNGPAWIGAGQASGALMDANPLGVLAACWGPTFLVPTLTGQHRGRRVIAITAMAVSWLSVLSSGSRSALLIAGIAVLYL